MKITDRDITKEELNAIYDDFIKIEIQDGIPQVERKRYNFIAEDNNKVIGFVSGLSHFHTWIFLSDMWVHENYRRQGLGSKLLLMFEEKVKSIGIKHIHTETSGFINPFFYEKNGYIKFAVLEDYHEVKGHHRIWYRKDFI